MSVKQTAKIDSPHAVFKNSLAKWEWRVLKVYSTKYSDTARWLCAVKSPLTQGTWDMGDVYIRDVCNYATLSEQTPEFREYWDNA